MTLRIYDPKDVIIVFGPAGFLSGFADGSFITIEKKEDAFTALVGVDGEVARAKSNNQGATITVSLMQDSASNEILSSVHIADLEAGAGVFPMLVLDTVNGTSLYEATKAWITRFPTAEYDKTAIERDWIFETDRLISFEGKNSLA